MNDMTDSEFKVFLNLLMCADPTPLPQFEDNLIQEWANKESVKRGFTDWIEAFHELEV